MRALIVAGGECRCPSFYRELLETAELIVCADGGYRNCEALGVLPNVVIGDFDSFPKDKLRAETIIELPTEKDRTDTHECVCYCLAHGATDIVLVGGIGTRLDHTLANLHLLALAKESGARMRIIDEHNEIFLLDQGAEIPKKEGCHISLLPVGTAEGISSEGLYYPLCDATMSFGNPYGVSNEFAADTAKVSLEKGQLLVILSRD